MSENKGCDEAFEAWVKRLAANDCDAYEAVVQDAWRAAWESALTARNAELATALEQIASGSGQSRPQSIVDEMRQLARDALAGKKSMVIERLDARIDELEKQNAELTARNVELEHTEQRLLRQNHALGKLYADALVVRARLAARLRSVLDESLHLSPEEVDDEIADALAESAEEKR